MKLLVVISLIAGVVMIQYALTDSPNAVEAALQRPSPSHYIEGQVHGVNDPMPGSVADLASTTWDFLFSRNARTPDRELPLKRVDLTHFTNPGDDQLNATWLGHSSLMINMDGYRILTDPVAETVR